MDLQAVFSDNQLAVIGCFAALAVCGAIAGLSFQFGTAGRKRSQLPSASGEIHPIRRTTVQDPRSAEAGSSRRAA